MQPNTGLFQIAATGIPLDKLVIGKLATDVDANNDYMDPSSLAQCVGDAAQQGWSAFISYVLVSRDSPYKITNAGIMVYQAS